MTQLLDKTFERTLDAWVREFEAPEYRGAQVQAWVFEDEAARRAAERRLAAAGVTAVFRSAYKPLVHFFLEDVDTAGLDSVVVRYPVHENAVKRRFTLEAYPLAGMLGEDVDVSFEAAADAALDVGTAAGIASGKAATGSAAGGNASGSNTSAGLYYEVALRYTDGRVETSRVFAPNHLVEDHAGVVNLSPTGWVRVQGGRSTGTTALPGNGARVDEPRSTEFQQVFAAIVDTVKLHPWGDREPYFERLRIRVDLPGIERELGYEDEVASTFEALHEDIYFGLLEVFQRHSGRPLGNRGLQPGQIVPDVRQAEGDARVRIFIEQFEAIEPVVANGAGAALEQMDGALPFERIAHEMAAMGGEPYTVKTRQGRPVLCTYVKGTQAPVIISGGQHANETSGVVGALRAAHQLKARGNAHFVLIGSENPDGYAMHRELCKVNPRHMHHAARYSALGDDLAYREREPLYELEARRKAFALCGANLHVNLHGYPAHEWTRPLSGYLPRGFELWTVPKGFFLVMRHHAGWADKGRALLESMTARLAKTVPGLVDFNARQMAMFRTHALEQGFEVMNGIPVQITEGRQEETALSLISEFPDETVYGERFRFAQDVQTQTVLAAVDGYLAL